MNPASYNYYQQQQLYRQYYGHNNIGPQYIPGPMFSRHITPQQWGSSLRGHPSYHYHQLQVQPFNSQFWSHIQWLQFHTSRALLTPVGGHSWNQQTFNFGPGPSRQFCQNQAVAVASSTEGDQVEAMEDLGEQEEEGTTFVFDNSDVKMVDITELDDSVDPPSEDNQCVATGVIHTPDSEDAESDTESSVSNKSDSRSLWIQKFVIDCQKNHDHMTAICKDWDAIKEKLAILDALSKEIDQIDAKYVN